MKKNKTRQLLTPDKIEVKPLPPIVPPTRTEYRIAAVISFLLPFLVYWRGLAPGLVIEGDSGEIISAIHEFSILHSPGFPGYMVTAKIFTSLLGWLDVAYSSNLFSAFCGALCSLWIFRIGRCFGLCWSALSLALTFAFAREFWYASLATEVYTFAILTLLLTVEALIRLDTGNRRSAFLLGLAMGFAFSGHVYGWALLPIVAGVALTTVWSSAERQPMIRRGLIGFTLGLAPYLYMPFRAGQGKYVNEGNLNSFNRFLDHVTWNLQRERVETATTLTVPEWIKIKLQQLAFFAKELVLQWGWPGLFIVLVALGLGVYFLKSDRGNLTTAEKNFALVSLINLIFMPSVVWLVFTGDSLEPGLLSEMAVHMLTFYVFLALCALIFTWRRKDDVRPASVLILLPIFLLVQRFSEYDLRKNRIAVVHAQDLMQNLPQASFLFGDNDNDLMTITERKAVHNERSDLVLLNLMNGTEWNYENYRKLYPELNWPDYTPTYYGPLLPMNLEKHAMYFTTRQGADGYLRVSQQVSKFDVVPVHGAFRLIEKGQNYLQEVLDDIKKSQYGMLKAETEFHLREREIDVIGTRAEYFLHQAAYLKANRQNEAAKYVISQAFQLPTIGRTDYSRAVQDELQKILKSLD